MTHVHQTFPVKPVIPVSAGIGLRPQHYRDILETKPKIAWFEVHSENYFGKGGAPLHYLQKIREDYPISLHGVGMSLGSVDPLNVQHLQALKTLIKQIEPGFISEHLSWSSFGGDYLNDLAPLPYNMETLQHLVDRVSQVQDVLGRQILIENPSSYLEFEMSTFQEAEFLNELSLRSGCCILLDINNVYVSCQNHGWNSLNYLQAINPKCVFEIHLAGHTMNRVFGQELLIDTHNRPVSQEVWKLYAIALELIGIKPTLIEWDTDVPALSVLVAEADYANNLMAACYEYVA